MVRGCEIFLSALASFSRLALAGCCLTKSAHLLAGPCRRQNKFYSVISAEVPCPSQAGTELCHIQEPDILDDERRASEVSGNSRGPS